MDDEEKKELEDDLNNITELAVYNITNHVHSLKDLNEWHNIYLGKHGMIERLLYYYKTEDLLADVIADVIDEINECKEKLASYYKDKLSTVSNEKDIGV